MQGKKELKEDILARIDKLSEDNLKKISAFIETLDYKDKRGGLIMSFAGSWKDMNQDTFNSLTNGLLKRRGYTALSEDWDGEDDG